MSADGATGGIDLHGRCAVVTGAGGSIGQAIVLGLSARGCRVVAIDRDAANLDHLLAQTGAAGTIGLVANLLDPTAVEQCIEEAWGRVGPLSILVNSVGLIQSAPLVNIAAAEDRRHSLDAWRRVIDANLTTAFIACAHVVERMVSNRIRGIVVNLSSIAAAGNAGQGAYSAAKAGVNAMTRAWAKELGPLGVRFVAIAPGFIDAPSTRAALGPEQIKSWVRSTPLRRLGQLDDIVSAVLFAIANEHLTGKILEIDGGLGL